MKSDTSYLCAAIQRESFSQFQCLLDSGFGETGTSRILYQLHYGLICAILVEQGATAHKASRVLFTRPKRMLASGSLVLKSFTLSNRRILPALLAFSVGFSSARAPGILAGVQLCGLQ